MQFQWLKARQTKYSAYLTIYILVIIAVLGAINWLANRYNKSYDSTANKRYSLSDQTIKVVKGLKQDVKITYFDRTTDFQRARDLLDRYDTLSTKLTVAYADPFKKPQFARAMGVSREGSIIVEAGPKREEAKSLSEEEVTSALIRALKSGVRTVCSVTGSGEHSFDNTSSSGFSSIKDSLEKSNYKTRTISLLEKPEVPQDCTILLVGGPRFDYTEPAVNSIRSFVEKGGSAVFLIDPPLQLGKEPISANDKLTALLDSWGVTLDKDLVIDASGIGSIFGLSEVVPLVASYETHPIVREMKDVATAFPLARSLQTKSGAEKLFSTSANSFATEKLSSAQVGIDPSKDKKGPFCLGGAGTVSGAPGGKGGRFVVVGSSGFIANNIVPFNGNRDLFLNMLNWLSSDEDLISIRPKEPEDRRLNLSSRQMSLIFWTSILGLPLLIVFAGLSVWWKRR